MRLLGAAQRLGGLCDVAFSVPSDPLPAIAELIPHTGPSCWYVSVLQFTLYADTSHGNRPGFTDAGSPKLAEDLYLYFIDKCSAAVPVVEHGSFGADMEVELVNDGPFTIILE